MIISPSTNCLRDLCECGECDARIEQINFLNLNSIYMVTGRPIYGVGCELSEKENMM